MEVDGSHPAPLPSGAGPGSRHAARPARDNGQGKGRPFAQTFIGRDLGGEVWPRERGWFFPPLPEGAAPGSQEVGSITDLRRQEGASEGIHAGKESTRGQRAPRWQGRDQQIRVASPAASWRRTRLSGLEGRRA